MRIHHYAIEVDDLEEAIIFYKDLLGLEIESQFAFMNEEITFLASDNFRLELIETTDNVKTTHICFEVDNLLDVIHLMDHNRRLEGPYKLQNGWETVFYKGPNQEIIEFLQMGNKL